MITIQKDISVSSEFNLKLLRNAINTTLKRFDKADCDITLRLTGDEEMRQLNLAYRGIDATTDVLSFNQDYMDPDTHRFYLGDIIISVDKALEQASENQQTLSQECAFLAIHGTLHLLGFDHIDPEGKTEMWANQEEIFINVKKTLLEKKQ